eukprot:78886_1
MGIIDEFSLSIIVGIICTVIMNCVFLPYDIYWLYKFWKNRNSLIIAKRHPKLLLISLILIWIWIIVYYSLTALIVENYSQHEYYIRGVIHITIIWPFLLTDVVLNATRYWLIFYTIAYNHSIKLNEWRNIINSTNSINCWFIKNKEKWANLQYLRGRIFTFFSILYIIIVFPYIVQSTNTDENTYIPTVFLFFSNVLIVICTVVLPITLYVYMINKIYKIPKIEDTIGMRAELIFSIYCIIIITILYSILLITFSQLSMEKHNQWIDSVLNVIFLLIRFILLIRTLRHTKWPLLTFKEFIIDPLSRKQIVLEHQETLLNTIKVQKTNEKFIIMEMRDVLNDDQMFDAFMRHLLNEYCAEILFSVIEFLQFKKKIENEHINIAFAVANNDQKSTMLSFPQLCPKSTIIFSEYDIDGAKSPRSNYKLIARKLYLKYICIGSKWEISIDSVNRDIYEKLFSDENKWNANTGYDGHNGLLKYYTLFDPCIEAMMSLLCFSFTRFKNSKQYKGLSYRAPNTLSPMYITRSKSS